MDPVCREVKEFLVVLQERRPTVRMPTFVLDIHGGNRSSVIPVMDQCHVSIVVVSANQGTSGKKKKRVMAIVNALNVSVMENARVERFVITISVSCVNPNQITKNR